jgi:SAM-dependent methyltransferase
MSNDRYVSIDEEGYFVFDGRRVDDETLGRALIDNLALDNDGRLLTTLNGTPAFVEAFDAPLMARHIRLAKPGFAEADFACGAKGLLPLASLSVDEWDRFHAVNEKNVPVVLSRQAQMELFELLDEFDDDSVTIQGKTYSTPEFLTASKDANSDKFWTNIYRTEEKPGWEIGHESPVLPDVLPQLRLTKARILVLGSGTGHDAAYLAGQGHIVTAIDFSAEAITRSKQQYGEVENLTFHEMDVFKLPENWTGRFDVIFEHTCFCAVSPDRREELIQIWRRLLSPGGHLLGIFFVHEKRVGPPFGGSEWELRQRLKPYFDFLYWTRWRRSIERRKGKELVVYAKKKST